MGFYFVSFEVLKAGHMNISVIWDVTSCSLIENYQCCGVICCPQLHDRRGRSAQNEGTVIGK
jgi:hypothetical protein